VARGTGSDFALLSEEIREAGLLKRQPRYYALRALASLGLLAAALALVLTADSTVTVALAAVLLGLAIGQAGSFTHDNGHRAIVGPGRVNEALGLFFGNVVAGASWSWWRDKHNAHHAHPNDPELDPDFNIKLLAFTREQAGAKRGLARWVTKHQAPLFVFMLPFESIHLHLAGVKHLLRNRPRYRWLEVTLLTVRTVVLVGALLAALPTGSALLALAVTEATFGFYFGSIFAPNHKGMPIAPDADYLRRQVLTSRNVRPGPFLDVWFIGLNYQIEHHLFPTLPRNHLRAARSIVRRFCAERDVPYVEVGLLRSWVEVLRGLSEASAGVTHAVTEPVDGEYSRGVV
jgi:fatty acid desaturase